MKSRNTIKIAVLGNLRAPSSASVTMDWVRWQKIGEALARLGYTVDLVTDDVYFRDSTHIEWYSQNFRKRSAYNIRWSDYQVIKILFHSGFQSFQAANGLPHPFIITKLGSVVSAQDQEGIYFFGGVRKRLFEIQNGIMQHSKYVTTLTDANENCLKKEYPDFKNYLRVPTGTDRVIPPPKRDPYLKIRKGFKICIYVGHLYFKSDQPELNQIWQNKLNEIGKRLLKKNIKLCFIGIGDQTLLNPSYVTPLGSVCNDEIWDCQYYADVGIALSDGPVCDNESSKIYYYLRGGLPVIAESPLPNSRLVNDLQYGEVVPYDDIDALCEAVNKWAGCGKGGAQRVMCYMADNHSWDKRVQIYDEIFKKEFGFND